MPSEYLLNSAHLPNENSASARKNYCSAVVLSWSFLPELPAYVSLSLVHTRPDGPAVSTCMLAACRHMQVCSSIRRLINQSSDFFGCEDSEQGTAPPRRTEDWRSSITSQMKLRCSSCCAALRAVREHRGEEKKWRCLELLELCRQGVLSVLPWPVEKPHCG